MKLSVTHVRIAFVAILVRGFRFVVLISKILEILIQYFFTVLTFHGLTDNSIIGWKKSGDIQSIFTFKMGYSPVTEKTGGEKTEPDSKAAAIQTATQVRSKKLRAPFHFFFRYNLLLSQSA